jgi:hypothetical protein
LQTAVSQGCPRHHGRRNSSRGAIAYGANIYGRPKAFKKPMGLEVDFIADRIKALVKAKKLESAGNLDGWRSSEIRLPKKTEQGT